MLSADRQGASVVVGRLNAGESCKKLQAAHLQVPTVRRPVSYVTRTHKALLAQVLRPCTLDAVSCMHSFHEVDIRCRAPSKRVFFGWDCPSCCSGFSSRCGHCSPVRLLWLGMQQTLPMNSLWRTWLPNSPAAGASTHTGPQAGTAVLHSARPPPQCVRRHKCKVQGYPSACTAGPRDNVRSGGHLKRFRLAGDVPCTSAPLAQRNISVPELGKLLQV